MSELQDRLTKIAERGTPRGFDDVFAEASKRADTLDVVPMVEELSARERKPRRPFTSLIAAAGVTSLLLVGMLAVSSMVGNGGADSPEGAVRQLANAVSHEDPLAAADVLAPNEVRSLHGTLSEAAQRAKELALVDAASAPLAGIDLSVDDLKLTTTDLADGYAKVTVDGGTLSARTEKPKFSALMQKVLRNYEDNSAQVNLASLTERLNNMPAFVVVVRDNGKWYVSAAYTLLEYVREYNHLSAAEFGSGERNVATLGADSPDAAVQEAMRALAANDWNRLISLAPPNEIPVYDYRAALTQLIAKDDAKTRFSIDTLTTTSQTDNDTAKVTLTASGSTPNGNTWSWKDGCFTETVPGDTGSPSAECVMSKPELFLPVGPMADPNASTTIKTVQLHGRWFVSGVGTALDIVDNVVQHMTQRDLYTLLRIPEQLPAEGPLTLGEVVSIPASDSAAHVYSFEGHKGEKLLGLATPKDKGGFPPAAAAFFDSDGNPVPDDGMLIGNAVVLPANGTYKVLIRSFGGNQDVTVTIWDAADAPAAAKQHPQGMCSYGIDGSGTCTSGSSSSSPLVGTPGDTNVTPTPGYQCVTDKSGATTCSDASATSLPANIDPSCTQIAAGDYQCSTPLEPPTTVAANG